MKTRLYKIVFLAYLLLTNFILFAKDGGGDVLGDGIVTDGDAGTDGSGGGDPPAPINSQLIWLALIGLAFAYYLYKNKKIKA
ncbi:MAG: hypothetical protein FGM16_09770 [Flavobacterium sp.]|nr:hypothetical protein [Flavobacterium sp.]